MGDFETTVRSTEPAAAQERSADNFLIDPAKIASCRERANPYCSVRKRLMTVGNRICVGTFVTMVRRRRSRMRVLFIDDDLYSLKMYRSVMEANQIEAICALTNQDALD